VLLLLLLPLVFFLLTSPALGVNLKHYETAAAFGALMQH
jgi:hypothetical protein